MESIQFVSSTHRMELRHMKPIRIATRLPVQNMKHGSGFEAQGIRGDAAVMDPYLMVDHFRMSEPTFGPHPHAGFSAVTYLFDDAATDFHNRDSLGDQSTIRPGDLHWTTAGAGVVHDEVPATTGQVAHGLQIFVNLAVADKHMAPGAIHIERERMPVVTQRDGAQVKVAFGHYDDGEHVMASVVALPTDATLLDVRIAGGQRFGYPAIAGQTAFLFVVAGTIEVADQHITTGQAIAFERPEDTAFIEVGSSGPSQFVLFLGQQLGEPVVRRGPFAMTNEADLDRAAARYQSGQMGHLDSVVSA